jgi:hypothetical protein
MKSKEVRWEYTSATNAEGDLNMWGKDGWELVSVTQSGDTKTFYFKRPLKEGKLDLLED